MRHNRFQLKIEKLEDLLEIREAQLLAAVLWLQQNLNLPISAVIELVNKQSGLTPEQIQQGNCNMLKKSTPVQQQFSNRKTEVFVRTSRLPKQKEAGNEKN